MAVPLYLELLCLGGLTCAGYLLCINLLRCYLFSGTNLRHPRRSQSNYGGVDPNIVRSLPCVSYDGAAMNGVAQECSVCLSEFENRETVKLIPYCGHLFHPTCIDTWLTSHSSCPMCRSSQLLNDEVSLNVNLENNDNGMEGGDADRDMS